MGIWILLAALSTVSPETAVPQVVFVCEHGSVKSVIAAEWFNRLAAERKVAIRGVSRGVNPDEAIPAGVAENLRREGFAIDGFRPKRLEKEDVAAAIRVIAIGADSPLLRGASIPVDRWDEIPPASTEYQRSREAMRQRLETLLEKLSKR